MMREILFQNDDLWHDESRRVYDPGEVAWIEGVENRFDLSYPDSPQALLDLLAHTAAQVLNRKISHQQALVIMHLVRAMERQTRWL